MSSPVGDRLCEHMRKAVHIKADTNDQLAELLGKLIESGLFMIELHTNYILTC